MKISLLSLGFFLLVFICGCKRHKTKLSNEEKVREIIEKSYEGFTVKLEGLTDIFSRQEKKEIMPDLRDFYDQIDYKSAWLNKKGTLNPKAKQLLNKLVHCDEEGIPTEHYHLERISNLVGEINHASVDSLLALELLLSVEFFRYGTDVSSGISRHSISEMTWLVHLPKFDLSDLLINILTNDKKDIWDTLEPLNSQYAQLKNYLAILKKAGQPNKEAESIRKVELNMERWRLVPRLFPSRYILVNIPECRLHVYSNAKDSFDMNIIAGQDFHPTPLCNDSLLNIVFDPYWNVPKDIAIKELLPYAFADSTYLERNNMEVAKRTGNNEWETVSFDSVPWGDISTPDFQYYIRQRPGGKNPLGSILFQFPNIWDVYLHDTPFGNLFKSENRTLSHGCIRLEDPVALAKFVLSKNSGMDEKAIRKCMQGNKEQYFLLKERTPVYILYFSAWADKKGNIQFYKDVYDKDKALEKAMGV
jgi:murein L,D-transpeptidase YcbB/YkuD